MGTCGQCAHWAERRGVCKKPRKLWFDGASVLRVAWNKRDKELHDKAEAEDPWDSEKGPWMIATGELWTSPDFGCTDWEQK